jgi:hypothetical protein
LDWFTFQGSLRKQSLLDSQSGQVAHELLA